MAKSVQKNQKTKPKPKQQEFVTVTFAKDIEEAKDYEALLKTNDIPTMTKEFSEETASIKGIAIMVPEDFIDEAHVVIDSQNAYDDFYDLAIEDEFADDFHDDEF